MQVNLDGAEDSGNRILEKKKTVSEVEKPELHEADLKNPWIQIHGTMVEVNGTGVLLLGDSGIGKSEAALELISRGHKLIADDAVVISNKGNKGLRASASSVTVDLLEIRGLGIINVREVFGNSALATHANISLCVLLDGRDRTTGEDRLGMELKKETLAGKEIPKFEIPVKSGRNIPVLVETAVRILAARNECEPGKT